MGELRTVSLFTGAGGLDLGFEAAGFSSTVAVERDPVAVRTLRKNAERWGEIFGDDVRKLIDEDASGQRHASRLLEMTGASPGDIDVLIGGPPCQPFSKSGYWASGDARRLADPRAQTLQAYVDVLETLRPRAFLLENVPGIAFSQKAEGLGYLRNRIAEVNARWSTRYQCVVAKLNAAEYGVPQLRERVFVVGSRDGLGFEFPPPTHAVPPPVKITRDGVYTPETPATDRAPATRAWDALGHLPPPDPNPDLQPKGKWAAVLPSIPEGANYLWHTERGGGIELWGWRRRYWSMLLKLAKDRPSWTLTAQPGPAIGPFHWNNRRLSAIELMALQTFPADYRIVGNNREAHKQLGNAVPSALAEVLARQIRRQLLGDDTVATTPTLLPRRASRVPQPETPLPNAELPEAIRKLQGKRPPHPGTGLGPGARARKPTAPR